MEEGAKGGRERKEQVEPAAGQRRQVADEFEQAQLSLFGEPYRRLQGGTKREGEQNEERAAIEITGTR